MSVVIPLEHLNVFDLIESHKNHLTKKEQSLVAFITQSPGKVMEMSITELSDTALMGEGTIVRFCQKLGFGGFQQFKIAIARSFEPPTISSEVIERLRQSHIDVIQRTSQMLDQKVLHQAAKAIADSRKTYLIGAGASGATAQDGMYKFMRIGIDAEYLADAHMMAMKISLASDLDVLIAFSQSGSTGLIVDLAQSARDHKIPVISVTGYARSPLAQHTDYLILIPTRETPFESGAVRSKIAQLHVLEVLFEYVFAQSPKKATNNLSRTAQGVARWIY